MISIRDIIRTVATVYQLEEAEIRSPSRYPELVWARHVAMWLAHELTAYSLPRIARGVGRSDHTTAMHGIARVNLSRRTDPAVREEIDAMAELIRRQEQIRRQHIFNEGKEAVHG